MIRTKGIVASIVIVLLASMFSVPLKSCLQKAQGAENTNTYGGQVTRSNSVFQSITSIMKGNAANPSSNWQGMTSLDTAEQPLINPVAGQYAIYAEDIEEYDLSAQGTWEDNYTQYVSPYHMSITTTENMFGFANMGWAVVNTLTRMVEDGDNGMTGIYYHGWIETNVTLGSTINLLHTNATITGDEILAVNHRLIDCWEVQVSDGDDRYTLFYDKVSGLCISETISWSYYGTNTISCVLQGTNVPIGRSDAHELVALLTAPAMFSLGQNVSLDATVYNLGSNNEMNIALYVIVNDTTVASTVLSTLLVNENYTLSYVWTPSESSLYNVTAYVPPVTDENYTEDNVASATVVCIYNSYTRTYVAPQWIDGGIGMGWHGYYKSWEYTLPFAFPFYGKNYTTIYVSSNGLITFNGPDTSPINSVYGLAQMLAIAPAWHVWRTDGDASDDIYVWQADLTHVIIRWSANDSYDSSIQVNFEVILGSDGVIQFNYGYSNGAVTATVGISNGAGQVFAEDLGVYNIEALIFRPPSSEHDVAVDLDVPSTVMLGQSATVNATVYNDGLYNETEVNLQLIINASIVDSITIQELAIGDSFTVNYSWTPAAVGSFNITVYAPPVAGETTTWNNVLTEMASVFNAPGLLCYTVEPTAIAPLTDNNASAYGLETPSLPNPVGQYFTVEIDLRNANTENAPAGVNGIEVDFDFSSILNYCRPVGFANMVGQSNGVFGPGQSIFYGDSPGFYDAKHNFISEAPYANATDYRVAAAIGPPSWNGEDGQVANITFQIIGQPSTGQQDFYNQLSITFGEVCDVNSNLLDVSINQGTLRVDAAGEVSSFTANINVEPLNTKSNCTWATGYISLPEGFNVSDIDLSSIQLNNTVMIDSTAHAVTGYFGNGSAPEIIVELDRTQLVNLVNSENIIFGNATIILTGQLLDGTKFEGSCLMTVSALIGDVDCNGKVSLQDLILLAKTYGSHPTDANWNGNADFGEPYNRIGLTDLVTLAMHYGQGYP